MTEKVPIGRVFQAWFAGRVVVITGAGRGIGLPVAEAFRDAGARVLAHVGREGGVGEVIKDCFSGDLGRRAGQDAFVDWVKDRTDRIDVLVNNAGTMIARVPFSDISTETVDQVLELNQTAVVRVTQGLLSLLECADHASIVSTSSIAARTGGSAGGSVYAGAKGFILTWTRALASELGSKGIRVNAVSPGVIDTDFHKRYSAPGRLQSIPSTLPLGRVGLVEDCVGAYLFLATPELSGYITGQSIEVNGGQFFA